jgi:Flp pilus assembly protein protease CpaA
MLEILFLFILSLIWIIFATIQDIKTKEIANWLNFSIIAFALGFRFFYSLFLGNNFSFFYQGIIGLGIFFIIGNLLYYGKLFAGGDAKLLISLGAILPFSGTFYENLQSFFLFLIIFLFAGAFYSLIVSTGLCLKNYSKFKKEFKKQFKLNRRKMIISLLISIFLMLASYINYYLLFLGIFAFLIPYLYLYAKAVDEISMIKNIETSRLREGDWLYKDVKIKDRIIKASWDGLKKSEISLLRKKYKRILIREGVVFTPVFLISFLIFFYLWGRGLRYSFW